MLKKIYSSKTCMSFQGTKPYTSLLDSDQTTKPDLRKFSGW